jgi:hypothetical protein
LPQRAGWAEEQSDERDLGLEILLTYGAGGGERPAVLLPGDTLAATIRASRLWPGPDGKVDYAVESKWVDSEGRVLLTIATPQNISASPFLKGATLARFLSINIPVDTAAGKYRLQVEAEERTSGRKATRELEFEILPPKTFGALNARLAHDQQGKCPAGSSVSVDQTIFVLFDATGYTIEDRKVDVRAALAALDEEGEPVGSEPLIRLNQRPVEPWMASGPSQYPLAHGFCFVANRPGRFILRLQLEDVPSGQKATYDLPLLVTATPDWPIRR